ncbi:MAG: gliding motility lipoprotein GldK [Raineya sp.]
MIMNQSIRALLFAGALAGTLASCGKKNKGDGYAMQVQRSDNVHKKGMFSQVTGIPYNLDDTGMVTSLKVKPYLGQPDGPNLVFIEGGRFVMGSGEEDILYTRDNRERTVSVQSFYMDMTEVANIHWLEFMNYYAKKENQIYIDTIYRDSVPNPNARKIPDPNWTRPTIPNPVPQGQIVDPTDTRNIPDSRKRKIPDPNWQADIPDTSAKQPLITDPNDKIALDLYESFRKKILLPDTTVWARETAFNDSYVANYLRYPGFRFFPVVGVSWVQAQEFCKWRTRSANEYLFAQAKKQDKDGKLNEYKTTKDIPLESGVIMPDYRLPTEAEWEYAAKGMIGTQYEDENQSNGRIYPWDGHATRNPYGKQMGFFLANFKRGRGDYAGIAGKQNDAALITEWIYQYPPNDFGLYNMGGNVAEWVEDVYRPLAYEDMSDLNPVRRIGLDETRLKPSPNRSVAGDSAVYYLLGGKDKNSLIDDNARVYKGGSWRDVAYFLSPGTRRFLDKNKSTDYIGFRCAMIMAGEKTGESRRKNKKVNGTYR